MQINVLFIHNDLFLHYFDVPIQMQVIKVKLILTIYKVVNKPI